MERLGGVRVLTRNVEKFDTTPINHSPIKESAIFIQQNYAASICFAFLIEPMYQF